MSNKFYIKIESKGGLIFLNIDTVWYWFEIQVFKYQSINFFFNKLELANKAGKLCDWTPANGAPYGNTVVCAPFSSTSVQFVYYCT